MRAAIIREHGGPGSVVVDENFPKPELANNEVLLSVKATSLNYHDIFTRRGMPGIKVPMPMIMGIDIAGEIVAVGSDVTGWSVGDRVVVDPVDRVSGKGLIGETYHGGLAEYCSVPAHQLVRLPTRVSYDDAASLPVAYGTAYRMMITRGQVQPGEKVLILGASGGVGTCCVLLAKMLGAHVIACASSEEKLERLKSLGADEGINYADSDFVRTVHEKFGKPHRRLYEGGVDVVVNFTGGDTWVKSMRTLRRGGRMLTCGATAGFDPKTDIRFIWSFELNILGSNGWMREDIEKLLDLVATEKLKPSIDATYGLDQVNEAIRVIEDRHVFGKVLVKP
jgi:NADPH:quinone reductase-like Zn-dependent oxidoreductase